MTIDTKLKASDFPNPHFIQGSAAPVFRGALVNGLVFPCANCEHVLIENYIERDFLSVKIKCFRCGEFTTTPPIEPGEIFSRRLADMGHEGAFLIRGTVDTWPGLSVTCSQALKAATALTSPRSEGLGFIFSEEGLHALVDIYNVITGNKFEIQCKIVLRTGDQDALKFPFAWSIHYLRSRLAQGVINIDDPRLHYSFR